MTGIDYIVSMFGIMFFMLLSLLFLFEGMKVQRILDRYRLKYSFDRDIEAKEISKEDADLKLNRRERNFKRRVFKD